MENLVEKCGKNMEKFIKNECKKKNEDDGR